MKDLLYLKDDQIKEFIQLLYYAYRETFSDPKEILSKKFFGPAHLRALNLIERYPGINLGELIFKLKVTKQSLNRVLRDLIKSRMIKQIQDETDTRKKQVAQPPLCAKMRLRVRHIINDVSHRIKRPRKPHATGRPHPGSYRNP